jgi:hypothetical protein
MSCDYFYHLVADGLLREREADLWRRSCYPEDLLSQGIHLQRMPQTWLDEA